MPVETVAHRRFPPNELHFSQLKHIGRSAAHFRSACLGGVSETAAMRIGSAGHVAALGGDLIVYEGERSGNAWKAFKGIVAGERVFIYDGPHQGKAWQQAKEDADGALIVTAEDEATAADARLLQAQRLATGRYAAPIVTRTERDEAFRVRDAIEQSCAAPLFRGQTEVPLKWSLLGLSCGGQLDVLGADFVTDLKIGGNSEPDWLARHAIKQAWPAQLSWYRDGARFNRRVIDECYLVAVEAKAPYAVTPMRITPALLEQGEAQIRSWVERFLVCSRFDEWPSYVQSVIDLDVPDDFGLTFGDDEEEEEEAA